MLSKTRGWTILLASLVGLTGCAPPDVPPRASTQWSIKGGFYWTWTQDLKQGCTSWMAKEEWASVELLVDGICNEEEGALASKGRGVSFFSPADYLLFRGYWPWSMDEYDRQIIADSEKEVRPVRSCGYQLSAKQLTELRKVGQDALDQAQTPGERRVLARINERLANVGSGPLSIRQEGCVDIPLGSGDPRSPNVWVNE